MQLSPITAGKMGKICDGLLWEKAGGIWKIAEIATQDRKKIKS